MAPKSKPTPVQSLFIQFFNNEDILKNITPLINKKQSLLDETNIQIPNQDRVLLNNLQNPNNKEQITTNIKNLYTHLPKDQKIDDLTLIKYILLWLEGDTKKNTTINKYTITISNVGSFNESFGFSTDGNLLTQLNTLSSGTVVNKWQQVELTSIPDLYVYINTQYSISTVATAALAVDKFKSFKGNKDLSSTQKIPQPPPGPLPGAPLPYASPPQKQPTTPPFIFPDLPAHDFSPYLVALFYPTETRKRIRNRLEFMIDHAITKDNALSQKTINELIEKIDGTPKENLRSDIRDYLETYYSTPYENMFLRLQVLMDLIDNKAIDYERNKQVYLDAISPDTIQYELKQAYIMYMSKIIERAETNTPIVDPSLQDLLKWVVTMMNEYSIEGMMCKNDGTDCAFKPNDFLEIIDTKTQSPQLNENTIYGSVSDKDKQTAYVRVDKNVYEYNNSGKKFQTSSKIIQDGVEMYVKVKDLAEEETITYEITPVDVETVHYLAYLTELRRFPPKSESVTQDQLEKEAVTEGQSVKITEPKRYNKDNYYYPCNYDDPNDLKAKFLTAVYQMNLTRTELTAAVKSQDIDPNSNKLYYMCVFITLVEFYIRLNKFNNAIAEFNKGHKPPGEEKKVTDIDSVYMRLCSDKDVCKEIMKGYDASDFKNFLATKQTSGEYRVLNIDSILEILKSYITNLEDNIYNILVKFEEHEDAIFKTTDEMMKDIEQITQANAKISYDFLKTLSGKMNFSNVTKLTTTVLGVIKYPDEKDSTKHSTLSGIIKTLDRYHSNFASRPEFNLELDKEAYLLDQFGKKKDEFRKYVSDIFDHNAFNTTLLLMYNVTHKHVLTQLIYELVKWCLLVKHEEDLTKNFVAKEGLKEIKDQIHEGLNEVLLYIAGYNAFFNKAIYVMLKFPTLQDYYSDDFEPLSNTEIESPTPLPRLELEPLVIFKESQEVPPTMPPNATPAKTQEPEPSAPPSPPESPNPPPTLNVELKLYDKFDKYKEICGKIKELLEQKQQLNGPEKTIAQTNIQTALNTFNDGYPVNVTMIPRTDENNDNITILKDLRDKDNLSNVVNFFTDTNQTNTTLKVKEDQIAPLNTIYEKLVTFYETLSGTVRVIVRVKDYVEPPKETNDFEIKIEHNINIHIKNKVTEKHDSFGPFYRVVGGTDVKNADIAEIIDPDRVVGSLMTGTNVLIFTYGYSGSGKTYTLFGKETDQGILPKILDTIATADIGYTLESITKHYGYLDVDKNKVPVFREDVKHLSQEECPKEDKDSCSVKNIYNKVQVFISEKGDKNIDSFIKSTVNNPQSSRGYVFIKFKVGERYLTFVDMAGSEDPYDMLIKLLPTYYIPSNKQNNTNFLTHKMARNKDAIFADVFEQSKKFLNDFTNQINEITFAIGSTKTKNDEVFKMHQKLLKCFFAGDQDTLQKLGCRAQSVPREGNILLLDENNKTGLAGLFMSVPYHKAVADYLDKNFKYLKAYSVEQILSYMKLQKKATQFQKIYDDTNWRKLMKVISDEKSNINQSIKDKINDNNLFVSMTKVESDKGLPDVMQVGFTDCPEIFDVWSAYLISQKIDLSSVPSSLKATVDIEDIDKALAEVETAMYKELYANRANIDVNKVKNLSYIMFVLNVIKKNMNHKDKIVVCPTSKKVYGSRYFKFNNTFYCMEASKPTDMTHNTLDAYFDKKQILANNEHYSQEYLERIIKEAFYINQANADLVTYFKNQMAAADPALPAPSASDKPDKKIGCKLDYDSLLIESYDQNLCIKPQQGIQSNTGYVTNIVKHIQNQMGDTKNIMVCTVRSEPEVKYRLGAIKTLKLVEDLKST